MARITDTSRADISACVPASVTVVIQPIAPSGSPAARAASWSSAAVVVMHRAADGCGLRTTAHRALIAISSL